MGTIEERATLNLQYEKDFLGNNLSDDMVLRAYSKGCYDQKAIYIDKACECMMNFKNGAGEFPLYDYVGNFRKAMEE